MHNRGHTGPGSPGSAIANAMAALLTTMMSVALASGAPTRIDHENQMRPWGCRTCQIPQAPEPPGTVPAGLQPDPPERR